MPPTREEIASLGRRMQERLEEVVADIFELLRVAGFKRAPSHLVERVRNKIAWAIAMSVVDAIEQRDKRKDLR